MGTPWCQTMGVDIPDDALPGTGTSLPEIFNQIPVIPGFIAREWHTNQPGQGSHHHHTQFASLPIGVTRRL